MVALIIVNIPFAVQTIQRAFEAIPHEVRDAAACCGVTFWRTLWRIELLLACPGLLTGLVLTFAHTIGELGMVLMVGGSAQRLGATIREAAWLARTLTSASRGAAGHRWCVREGKAHPDTNEVAR